MRAASLLRALPILAVLVAVTPAAGGSVPTAAEVRALLDEGRTEKAAQALDRALADATPAQIPELRYFRFKTHVLDLAPGNESLYKKLTKGVKDGMEFYEDLLEAMEAEIRAEGEAVLPVLVDGLVAGDSLDRLLVLGILADMAGEDLPWSSPAGRASPAGAARDATLAALDDCARREDTLGAQPAYAFEDQREREPYVEAVYAAESGLEFLAVVDPEAWGVTAAFALECRSLAGIAFGDRARLRKHGDLLREPLVGRLESSEREPARMDAVGLLGRVGGCDDLDAVRSVEAGGGELGEAATVSIDRIVRRLGCTD